MVAAAAETAANFAEREMYINEKLSVPAHWKEKVESYAGSRWG